MKVRVFAAGNESYEYASQLFFDEAFTDKVYAANAVYGTKARNTLNSTDGISTGTITSGAGQNLMLTLRDKTQ